MEDSLERAVPWKKLGSNVLEPVAYYMRTFDKDFSMTLHQHRYLEIMYCQKGEINFEVYEDDGNGGCTTNEYKMCAGEFVIVDALTPHRICPSEGCIVYNVEFLARNKSEYNPFNVYDMLSINYSGLLKGGWAQIADMPNGYAILSDTENVESSLHSYLSLINRGINSFEEALAVHAALLSLISEIGKCRMKSRNSGSVYYVRRAQEYLNRNFSARIRIEDVAEHVGISKAYLQRIYRTYTGTTLLATINNIRVDRAKQLLINTSLPVKEIVSGTGFQNSQQLIYEFKRIVGMPPSEFRKKFQRQEFEFKGNHDSSPFFGANEQEGEDPPKGK